VLCKRLESFPHKHSHITAVKNGENFINEQRCNNKKEKCIATDVNYFSDAFEKQRE
jgi:hypothetical protein